MAATPNPTNLAPPAQPRPRTLASRVSSAWDWTLCLALLASYLLQAFLPERIGWVGIAIGILVVLLVAQRLHSRRHQLELLRERDPAPRG
ncbi:MAG: hypothetical protein HZA52_11765 [Planctomycetes bacterium]|nr:hypothetical protein [Planctomycetota bacterium]